MAEKIFPMIPKLTSMKQPNKVTYASYDYTLIQQKVLTYIIYYLQQSINEQVKNKINVSQLDLFKNTDKIQIPLILRDFATHGNYKHVIDSVKLMASTLIKFPEKRDKNGITYYNEGHLISNILTPKVSYKKEIIVLIDKDVATDILNVERGFTRFAFEISFNTKNKYTGRIYQIICRWRDTGGFRMKYSELRDTLGIDDNKYKDWSDFKKRVIKDVQLELNERADVWFEVEMEKGEDGQYLNFKVITSELMSVYKKQKEQILTILKVHLGYNESDYKSISIYLLKPHLYIDLMQKLIQLAEHVKSNNEIASIPAYVNASIIKEFKHRLK